VSVPDGDERSADDQEAQREQEAERRRSPYFAWSELEAKAMKARRLITEMVPLLAEAKLDSEHREFLEDDLAKIEQAVKYVRVALTDEPPFEHPSRARRRKDRSELEEKAIKARRLIAQMAPLIAEAKLGEEHREFLRDDLTKIEQAVLDVVTVLADVQSPDC